jgi:SAM-dependent methyltransferase
MDAPDHTRYRRIFQKAFLPQVVSKWGETVVDPVVNRLMNAFIGTGKADLIEQFTHHYPFQVIYAQLELEPEQGPVFHKLAIAQLLSSIGAPQGREASTKLGTFFAELLAQRRLQPGTDLVSHLATVESDGERLPDISPVDVVIAAEVLCYVEDVAAVLRNVRGVLKPGGALLASVEGRWGWSAAYDAPPGSLDALLTDGIVHVPGDKWVRTYDGDAFRAALAGWAVEELVPTHYIPCGAFENAAGPLPLDQLLSWEARLRAHPMTAPWNRAWMAVAR